MLTYKFSRREKAMLLLLAIALLAVAWYFLVFQSANDQITKLDSQISEVQSEISVEQARVARLNKMEQSIEEHKAAHSRKMTIPNYDNIENVMAELNGIMEDTNTYTLTFGDLDRESSEYIMRPVKIDYNCDTYKEAEQVVTSLARGRYPCRIDSVVITDGSSRSSRAGASSGSYSATVQVTFYEKPNASGSSGKTTASSSSSASASK